jgi:hypothetical protein
VIGLMDKLPQMLETEFRNQYEILEIDQIQIPGFNLLIEKYNAFELSCVAKPYFAHYLFETQPEVSKIIYLDADLLFYHPIDSMSALLDSHSIVLSPHVTKNLVSDRVPRLRNFLNAGIYNTGYLGLKRTPETREFISWWADRLWHEGYHNFAEGMFVDQLWVNFAPLLFSNVHIDTHPGHNLGYWNLHERVVSERAGIFYVNEHWPLVFYHFSGYSPSSPSSISIHQDLYSFSHRPDIRPVFDVYQAELTNNQHQKYSLIQNHYYNSRFFDRKKNGLRRRLIVLCRRLLRTLEG